MYSSSLAGSLLNWKQCSYSVVMVLQVGSAENECQLAYPKLISMPEVQDTAMLFLLQEAAHMLPGLVNLL